jgi:hypothetical protein
MTPLQNKSDGILFGDGDSVATDEARMHGTPWCGSSPIESLVGTRYGLTRTLLVSKYPPVREVGTYPKNTLCHNYTRQYRLRRTLTPGTTGPNR